MTDIHLPIFKTKRLTIRHMREDDFDFMRELESDALVMKYIGSGMPKSEEETLLSMQKNFANYEVFEMGMFIVEDSLTLEKLGQAGLFPRQTDGELLWEIGYSLKPSAWGKGYATEAATYLMQWGLENIETDFLVTVIRSDNLESIHVASKLGLNHWKDISINEATYSIYRTL